MQLAKRIQKIDEKNSVVYEMLFNTAYYIATENESFRKFPQFPRANSRLDAISNLHYDYYYVSLFYIIIIIIVIIIIIIIIIINRSSMHKWS